MDGLVAVALVLTYYSCDNHFNTVVSLLPLLGPLQIFLVDNHLFALGFVGSNLHCIGAAMSAV